MPSKWKQKQHIFCFFLFNHYKVKIKLNILFSSRDCLRYFTHTLSFVFSDAFKGPMPMMRIHLVPPDAKTPEFILFKKDLEKVHIRAFSSPAVRPASACIEQRASISQTWRHRLNSVAPFWSYLVSELQPPPGAAKKNQAVASARARPAQAAAAIAARHRRRRP
jgi:hypothetical protein